MPIACAKLKLREMLMSPAVSINALIIKEKLIFPIEVLVVVPAPYATEFIFLP